MLTHGKMATKRKSYGYSVSLYPQPTKKALADIASHGTCSKKYLSVQSVSEQINR